MIALLLITLTAQADEKEATYIDFEETDITATSAKPSINFVFETARPEFKPLVTVLIIKPTFNSESKEK